jgi:hypothetical protein
LILFNKRNAVAYVCQSFRDVFAAPGVYWDRAAAQMLLRKARLKADELQQLEREIAERRQRASLVRKSLNSFAAEIARTIADEPKTRSPY